MGKPEYEEKPFTEFGQFGPGNLDLRVFVQDTYWVDVYGEPHLISEMREDYRRNVIIHLLDNARFFHAGIVLEQAIVALGQAMGYAIESSFESDVAGKESLRWLEATTLMKHLRAATPNAPTLDIDFSNLNLRFPED